MKHKFSPSRSLSAGTFAISLLFNLLCLVSLPGRAATLTVPPAAGGDGIQQALVEVGAGGQVVLSRGTYLVHQPIILDTDGQTLRGAGPKTILCLSDNTDCPVVILGAPMNNARKATHGLHLCDLLVDGNRSHQQSETWRFLPSGARLNNDGVIVWDSDDATIEHVICRQCRSGGLVSTGRTRRLTVRDYTGYDNQFDGLACYRTEESHFSHLNLYDNLAAGISLDLGFDHNVIDGAVLTGNNLGVFMRHSGDNVLKKVTIRRSRRDGVFMAHAGGTTPSGWQLWPGGECAGNKFDNLRVIDCGGRAFQVNDASCTNNFINGGQFLRNAQGGLCPPTNNPVTARGLKVIPP